MWVTERKKERRVGLLSERELEVLVLIAENYSNPEIAERLVISVDTAKTHVSHILVKLEVRDRREAARLYRSEITRNG
jgi:DNA-binding NarL/FixJ family response regulator